VVTGLCKGAIGKEGFLMNLFSSAFFGTFVHYYQIIIYKIDIHDQRIWINSEKISL
jgi:hypothetical protein